MATFTYVPDKGFSSNVQPRVLEVKFGDGYSQRIAETVNPISQTWNLTFKNRANAEADAILQFFVDRQGSEAFDWTPPGSSSSYKVICRKWKETYTAPFAKTVTATFERVYET